MAVGVLICALGLVPLYASGITIGTLEGAASILAIGIFVFLVGIFIRRVTRALRTT
jgi:hypothetical protein